MGKLILSVDDDRDVLDCLELILPTEGYSVVTSLSPENIFEDVLEYIPDLILLDIQMGRYNGLDICKELKSNSFTSYIPVLMLSSDQRSSDDISEYQADGIIIKPFQIADMIKQIGEFGGAKIIPFYRSS